MAVPFSLVYLDVDDEITSAANRIRKLTEMRVALVLPAGSRLATSRMNFRLLAREAQTHAHDLFIVAPEAATRALAASAGLAVYATVRDLEAAMEATSTSATSPAVVDGAAAAAGVVAGATRPASAADRGGAPDRPEVDRRAGRRPMPPPVDGAGGLGLERGLDDRPPGRGTVGSRSAAADLPVHAGPRHTTGRGRTWLVVLAVVVVVAFVGGFIGFQYLPAATIVVTPRVETIGPMTFNVTADPTATAPDLAAGIVPATQPSIPLDATGDYPATDKKVTETKASGTVTFSSFDPARSNRIVAGSIVATQADTQFVTTQTVILPPATLVGLGKNRTVVPSTGDSPVTAAKPGTGGNVAAGAIKIVPTGENAVVTTVTNQAATSGGTHTETLVVGQKDIDKAIADLTAQIDAELEQFVTEPSQILPDVTVFAATKSRTDPTPAPDPTTLLGQQVQSFSLEMTATGTVTAVDEAAVAALATDRLRGTVTAGKDLVKDSLNVTVGDGRVVGQDIVFPVHASAQQVRRLVAADLRDAVRGRTLADARSILEAYGETTISLWPGFVSSIPTNDSRIDLTVKEAVAVEGSPGPSPSSSRGTPPPTLRATPRPSARPSPSGSAKPGASASPKASGSGTP